MGHTESWGTQGDQSLIQSVLKYWMVGQILLYDAELIYLMFSSECLRRKYDEKTIERFRMTMINSLNQKCREAAKQIEKVEDPKKSAVPPKYVGSPDPENSDSDDSDTE